MISDRSDQLVRGMAAYLTSPVQPVVIVSALVERDEKVGAAVAVGEGHAGGGHFFARCCCILVSTPALAFSLRIVVGVLMS